MKKMSPRKIKIPLSTSRSSKRRDFVYENPPLIEVIVEVHWEMQRLPSMDGAIDPFYFDFVDKFRIAVKKKGFIFEEDITPPGVPIEFLGNQPVKRFRRKEKTWPLFQIGPGVMTVNIIPPYQGWEAFIPSIRDGLNALFNTHKGLKKSVKINRLVLRYINGFDKKFGMNHMGIFVDKKLNLSVPIPSGFNRPVAKVW